MRWLGRFGATSAWIGFCLMLTAAVNIALTFTT